MPIKKKGKAYQDEEEEDIGDRVLDEEEEEKDFSDDFDIIKDVTDVHEQKRFGLNKNFVLMKGGDTKLVEFITRQHLVAIKSYNLLPNKKYGKKAFNLIMAELEDRAIMTRNVSGNIVLRGIFARGMNAEAQKNLDDKTEHQGLVKKTTNKIKGFMGMGPDNKEKDQSILN